MATIGVLTYTLPHGLKIKGHANGIVNLISNNNNSNISIRHINNSSNNQIANSDKKSKPIIGDLPSDQNSHQSNFEQIQMIKSDLLAMRRKQKCMPLNDSTMDNIQSMPPAKRPRITNVANESKAVMGGTPLAVKKVTSQPQAVARRNARERNRVKQVNNGFAALREHIPEEVAVAFEAGGSGRGTNKKLSKVETLRMAVEYIRSLERLLGLDPTERTREDDINSSEMKEDSSIESAVVPSDDTMTVIKTEECSSPIDDLYFDSSCDQDESTMYYTDCLPDITTINGQQYLRIPGTNTYQLVTVDMFENEENIQPIPGADYNNMQIEQDIVNRLPSPLASNKFLQTTLPEIIPSGRVITTISSSSNIGQCREVFTSTPNVEFLHHDRAISDLGTSSIGKNGNIVTAQIFDTSTVTTDTSSVLIRKFVESSQLYDAVVPSKAQIKEESIVLEATNLNEDVPLETIDWWDAHRSNEAIIS